MVNVVGGGVAAQAVVGGGDKGLVLGYLLGRKISTGSINGIAIDVQPLAGGDEGAVHLAVKVLNGLC